jgi:hypothetical protein
LRRSSLETRHENPSVKTTDHNALDENVEKNSDREQRISAKSAAPR